MHAEEAGEAAAEALFTNRWNSLVSGFVQEGADRKLVTEELLHFLYFAGYTAIHIALFDLEHIRERVQIGYSLAWDQFARNRSHTAHISSRHRLSQYTAALRQNRELVADEMARLLCGFLHNSSGPLLKLSAKVFDDQMMFTMSALREMREKGIE